MSREVYVYLKKGSLTELRIKLALAQAFGSTIEYNFYKSTCRMLFLYEGKVTEGLVGIYVEIPKDNNSTKLINFLEKYQLKINKENIIGIISPTNWSNKISFNFKKDLKTIEQISAETNIPIIGADNYEQNTTIP